MENIKSVIYGKDVLEFVTVGVQFCAYLEQDHQTKQKGFINTLLKLLPLLYLKAMLLPRMESAEDFFPEEFVTEQDYDAVRAQICTLLEDKDSYLDLDISNVHYAQEPQVKSISEDLADVYQAVRNFVTAYKLGIEQSMYEGLGQVVEQFDLYWGQTLLNALRALHSVHFSVSGESDSDEEDNLYDDENQY